MSTETAAVSGRVRGLRPARPIVLSCDEGFAMPLAVALRSIVDASRSPTPVEFHVLSNGFSAATKEKILASLPAGRATIEWTVVDVARFRNLAAWDGVTHVNYARFTIAELLPRDVPRALYLDADIVVLDDLEPLWDVDLNGAAIGAVRDPIVDQMQKENRLPDETVPRVRGYFNAGIMLMDLARWRSERISERALDYLARHPAAFFADQDGLNFACDGLWHELPKRWNYQEHRKGPIAALPADQRPAIVHFITNEKPWNPEKQSVNARFYDGFRQRTLFARTTGDRVRDAGVAAFTATKRFIEAHILGPEQWQRLRRAFGRGKPDRKAGSVSS